MAIGKQFKLPDLLETCPLMSQLNPHYKQAGGDSAAWIDSYHVFRDRKRAFFIQSSSELLCAYTYPYAGCEELRIVCDFVNLLFVVDEVSDDQDGLNARVTADTYLTAMTEAPCNETKISRITKE